MAAEGDRNPVDDLPAKLLAVRESAGLSRPDAALMAAVGKGNLWQYETGAKTPTLAVLYKLAAAYGCNVCDLLPGGVRPVAAAVAVPPPAPRPKATGKFK